MVARDRVLCMGQIELFDILTEGKQMTDVELKVGHEPRLEPCLIMLVIDPLSAMWAWLA